MRSLSPFLLAAFCCALSSHRISAGTFTSDFNSAPVAPLGTTLNGSAVIESTGGLDDSGVLKLTKNVNSQSGSFVIDDLDAGAPVYGFDLTAKVRLGGGTSTPADGFSINYDPTASPVSTTGEEGTTGGITFAFDIYDNSNEVPPAPSIDVKVGGVVVATRKMTIPEFETGAAFADLHIRMGADGGISLAWKGAVLLTNIYFANYQPLTAASFVFGARTGGLNENQWIDDLRITTFTEPQVGISQQPLSQTVLSGQDALLSVTANNAESATYQWFRNDTALPGATGPALSLPNVRLGQSGERYKVTVTGPNNTVTSGEAILTVKEILLPSSPTIAYNFNDGAPPLNTLLLGMAMVAPNGGVADSGALLLTLDMNDQSGALIIPDLVNGAPVYSMTAQFDVLIRTLGTSPADGFSFNFADDIPEDPTISPPRGLEDGTGSGLTVGFDIYDNGGGEAPSIDVIYRNQGLASAKVPLSFITTGDQYAPVIIHLENDGTLDVVYKGVVVHDNVALPGFSSLANGQFALAGRTGGSSADQWIDNLRITAGTVPGSLRITVPPAPAGALLGRPVTFSAAVNDPAGVIFQWFKNGAAISGASSSTYTTPPTAVADHHATFQVTATKGNLSATSEPVSLTVFDLSNPTLSYNFDSGTRPTGTVLVGNDPAVAGYIADGVVHLVDAVNSASAAFVVPPVLSGAELGSVTVAFDLLMGGGTTPPADGFSFNFARDASTGTLGDSEDGTGTGLTVGFDIYNNGNETPPAPSVDIRYKGAVAASVQVPYSELETGDTFTTVIIHVSAAGTVDVVYGQRFLFKALPLPNYTPISSGRFGFYARTGGLNENIWLDNLAIRAEKTTAPLRITQDLADVAALPGTAQTFTVSVSDPSGVSYQWFKNGTVIPAANSDTYTTPSLTAADDGTTYQVQATGPGGSVTSHSALVTVVAPLTAANPKISYDFNDGQTPPGAELNGTATAATGDGILHLTEAENSQAGSIIIYDVDNGQPVSGFVASFKLRVGGGTTPPADGLSFVWVTDLPSGTTFGEDGSGTGLVVSYDIYDNGNETPPAPSIDIRYKGQAVATRHLPYQDLETGDSFADFVLRVENDGTLDLHFKNTVLFHNVPLPGFAPISGASFGIGARTGGLNDNHWLDDLKIATTTGTVAPQFTGISKNAAGQLLIQWSGSGTLQSTDTLSNRNWTSIPGARSPFTVTPTAPATFYRLVP